ncbi:MAG: amidohydrolase [Pseudomonadota bacterium]
MDLVAFRRDLHRHPEIGLDLPRTAACVADVLAAAGLEVSRDVGGSGLVATLGTSGRIVGLRADMDALPINEATDHDYPSQTPARFHGCGHDGHTTMLLGAALAMVADPPVDRTIRFVFQADEENGTGARAMLADGLLDRFAMDAIYGLHNMPGVAPGTFVTGAGPFFAFEDNFEIRLTGRGGHASAPEVGTDALVAGAALVGALQTIVSRGVAGRDHAVVSVTEFVTDGARNVIPSNVALRGDCRGYADAVSARIEMRMRDIAAGIAATHGVTAEVDYGTSFRPLVNPPQATARAREAAAQVGPVHEGGRYGASEDFAEFLAHIDGAFVLMGNGTEDAHALPLHNPAYDFNDAIIPAGIAFWQEMALRG